VLDNSIGLSVSRLVLKKFQLLRATAKTEDTDYATESESVFVEPSAPLTLAAGVSAGEVINIE